MMRLRKAHSPEALPSVLRWVAVVLCMMQMMLNAASAFAAQVGEAPKSSFARVCLNWLPQSQFAGYIMASEKGFFAARGLDVRLMWTAPGENPLDMLARGEVEFATVTLDAALIHWAQGLPVVQVMQLHQRNTLMLVTRKEIQRLDQLTGQVVQAWNWNTRNMLNLLFKTNNVEPSQVLPQSYSLAPFVAGLVGAAQARDFNEYLQLQEYGLQSTDFNVFSFADYELGIVGDGLYTLQGFAHENEQLVRDVRAAVIEGWNYAFTHEQETAEVVKKYTEQSKRRTNVRYQLSMLQAIRQVMTDNGAMPLEEMGRLREKDFVFAKDVLMRHGYALDGLTQENFVVAP